MITVGLVKRMTIVDNKKLTSDALSGTDGALLSVVFAASNLLASALEISERVFSASWTYALDTKRAFSSSLSIVYCISIVIKCSYCQ